MDFWISFVLCFLVTIAAVVQVFHLIARRSKTNSCKLPPGPPSLPIIGNILDLGDKPHKSLANLAKTHGPLMTLKLGRMTTIVISSATLAEEVLKKHDMAFSSRTVVEAIKAQEHHETSVAWLPVETPWRNLRKLCNSYIFSTQKLDANQHLRLKKVECLLADVHQSCLDGKAVDIGKAVFRTTLNALSDTLLSLDLTDLSSDTVREFKEVARGVMDEVGKPNLVDYFPILRKIDPQGIGRSTDIHFRKIINLFGHIIDERLRLRKGQDYIPTDDLLDTLVDIGELNSEKMSAIRIKHLFLDLFVAGTDTTSSTLEWAMAELLRNPKSLSKARAELEQNIGRGKLLEESDTARLPYLQAVIKETFRMHPAVPLLLPRKAGKDVEICGFTVPKDAQVLVNAWAIGHDSSIWEDPESFVPERFLGSDIEAKGQNFELIPFGAGRRICPGLPMAIRMLHLMLGSLIHSFDWKLEDGVTPESMDMNEKFGLTLQKAHPLRAVPIQA